MSDYQLVIEVNVSADTEEEARVKAWDIALHADDYYHSWEWQICRVQWCKWNAKREEYCDCVFGDEEDEDEEDQDEEDEDEEEEEEDKE